MRANRFFLGLLLCLCCVAPARAQPPQLWLYMSASASDVTPGAELSFTLSAYTSVAAPTPMAITVELPDAFDALAAEVLSNHSGIACTTTPRQAVCTAVMEDQKPLTMVVRARAQLAAQVLTQTRARISGGGDSASASVNVRIDHQNIFLPLMTR